ncbi:MAG: SDR family NAD(P)-dependent oxidoreductase [Thermoguttaceae bacterium]|nr:SDR family NAD(P)-dependent oxidoreductase [Thermoguttaceae bacterium]
MKRRLKEARCIITGASSGIGEALARTLAREGARLVLTARRAEKLDQLASELQEHDGKRPMVVAGDITSEALRASLVQTAVDEYGGLDILINNAGVGAMGLIGETSDEAIRRLAEVNWFAVVDLIGRTLPELRASACDTRCIAAGIRPMIVNFGSVVGFRGTPHYGIYGAMKAAVGNMSESLGAELVSDKIDVLLVCPGTTSTGFVDSLLECKSQPSFPKHHTVSPEYVARQIVTAMKKGRHRLVPHFESRILYYLNRFSPGLVDWIMARYR